MKKLLKVDSNTVIDMELYESLKVGDANNNDDVGPQSSAYSSSSGRSTPWSGPGASPSPNYSSIVSTVGEDHMLLAPAARAIATGSSCRSVARRSRYRTGLGGRKLRKRVIFKNGECNVFQSHISQRRLRYLQDIFTTLVDTQWRWTLLVFALSFILSWLGFAAIWWLISFTHGDFEPDHLPELQEENNWKPCIFNIYDFASCFLFSIETQHTIGYGSRGTTEECPEAIFIMCLQSITGVMIQAFMVGIVFAKMSRPKQRTQTLLFSRSAVVCQRDGNLCLMFRVGDMRKSHIIGASIRAQLIKTRQTQEGELLSQSQCELDVGTDYGNADLFFIWPMTVVHRITSDSPLYKTSANDLIEREKGDRFELVVILEGTIESTGQTTQARSSYLPNEILWGHRFEPMVTYNKDRQAYEVNYNKFNNTYMVDTPLCSAKDLEEFYAIQQDLRQPVGTRISVTNSSVSAPSSGTPISSAQRYSPSTPPEKIFHDIYQLVDPEDSNNSTTDDTDSTVNDYQRPLLNVNEDNTEVKLQGNDNIKHLDVQNGFEYANTTSVLPPFSPHSLHIQEGPLISSIENHDSEKTSTYGRCNGDLRAPGRPYKPRLRIPPRPSSVECNGGVVDYHRSISYDSGIKPPVSSASHQRHSQDTYREATVSDNNLRESNL